MKLDFNEKGYAYITDDTSSLDDQTLFIKTAQNSTYYEKLDTKPETITSIELISIWNLESMKVIGVTGTNGKTTVTAAIYSFMLDLDEKPALQGTRGLFGGRKAYRRQKYDYAFYFGNVT